MAVAKERKDERISNMETETAQITIAQTAPSAQEPEKKESPEAGGATSSPEAAEAPEAPEKPKRPYHPRTKRPRRLRSTLTLADVLEALKQTGGKITDAVKVLDIDLQSFYQVWRYNPDVVKAIEESRQIGFEKVTQVLMDLCMQGDTKAISLYLKYNPVAKRNDWLDTQTISLKQDKPLTPDEKQELVKQLFG